MNNNRGNNRRRGRNNNRPQGGGQQLNRIDSRARGNAPQLLEKYRKLAHDAHLNGDRVTEEYYLQFADHYFRVIADTRQRQEDQRQRRDERWEERSEDGEEQGEFGGDVDYAPYEQVSNGRPREDREPREGRDRNDRNDRGDRNDRPDRGERQRRDRGEGQFEAAPAETAEAASPAPASDEGSASIYEPAENPFLRETRAGRGLKPRREDRRPRREQDPAADGEPGFDMAVLPPSLNAAREQAPDVVESAEPVAPKRRGRKPKAAPAEAVDEG